MIIGMETDCVLCQVRTEFYVLFYTKLFLKLTNKSVFLGPYSRSLLLTILMS
jgi:hypothetical protein